MAGPELGIRLGMAVAQIGSTVRERSLARATPALVKQAAAIVDAEAGRRAQLLKDRFLGFLRSEHSPQLPIPPFVEGLFNSIGGGLGLAFHSVISQAIGFGVGQSLSTVLAPFFLQMAQEAWRGLPVQTLSPELAASMVARGLMEEEEARNEAVQSGVNPQRFDHLVTASQAAITAGEVLALLNRGEIDQDRAMAELVRTGLPERSARALLSLRHVLPGAQDVVRFGVREVYTPEIAEAYGLAQDFPQQAVEDARRIGLSEEEFVKFWMAHWDLPSVGQAFEMFHRQVITEGELNLLLRALDVMPAWRDRLVQIAYNVPGRIDLRRMFKAGVIAREEVFRGYLDLGYDPTTAETLTRFAVEEKMEAERDLSKAEVMGLFQDQVITREEAVAVLADLGYDQQEAAMILAVPELRRARRYRDAALGTMRARYVGWRIDQDQLQAALDLLGVLPEQKVELMALWDLERQANVRDVPAGTIAAAMRRGDITRADAETRLGQIGYAPGDWVLFLGRPT